MKIRNFLLYVVVIFAAIASLAILFTSCDKDNPGGTRGGWDSRRAGGPGTGAATSKVTVAGDGNSGTRNSGRDVPGFNDGDASVAEFAPDQGGITFDGEGNLYIADALNNRVRKVSFK